MSEPITIYRVSKRFLVNLCQQAFYGMVGVIVSWSLFWMLSQQLLPAQAGSNPVLWLLSPRETAAQLIPHQERELLRCLVGPGLAVLVLFGGLVDFLTWVFVRYEIREDRLSLCWGGWSRNIAWDVVQTVRERSPATTDLRSMIVSASEVPPILVRGVERMPEFAETVRARISRDAEWSPAPYRIDLTSRSTNFVLGFLLPIPIHATWLAGYVVELNGSAISLIWAWLAMAMAVAAWYWRPLSRRHMCAVEIELTLAVLMLVMSGTLTLVSSMPSPNMPPWAQFLW